jgi:hypothetical protein
MTKAELIKDLEDKDYIVGVENIQGGDLVHPHLRIKAYQVNVFAAIGDIAEDRTIDIYVRNEGLEDEKAYYKNEAPEEKVRLKKKAIEEAK